MDACSFFPCFFFFLRERKFCPYALCFISSTSGSLNVQRRYRAAPVPIGRVRRGFRSLFFLITQTGGHFASCVIRVAANFEKKKIYIFPGTTTLTFTTRWGTDVSMYRRDLGRFVPFSTRTRYQSHSARGSSPETSATRASVPAAIHVDSRHTNRDENCGAGRAQKERRGRINVAAACARTPFLAFLSDLRTS